MNELRNRKEIPKIIKCPNCRFTISNNAYIAKGANKVGIMICGCCGKKLSREMHIVHLPDHDITTLCNKCIIIFKKAEISCPVCELRFIPDNIKFKI